jgi:hypothetical protein
MSTARHRELRRIREQRGFNGLDLAVRLSWRKSSHSGGSGNTSCVEVAVEVDAVGVRDSKNTDGPQLAFPAVV